MYYSSPCNVRTRQGPSKSVHTLEVAAQSREGHFDNKVQYIVFNNFIFTNSIHVCICSTIAIVTKFSFAFNNFIFTNDTFTVAQHNVLSSNEFVCVHSTNVQVTPLHTGGLSFTPHTIGLTTTVILSLIAHAHREIIFDTCYNRCDSFYCIVQ